MKRTLLFSAGILLAASGLRAQTAVQYGRQTFQFVGTTAPTIAPFGELIGSGVVTGRPFSATEERTSRQTLGDGTKIETKETNRLFRDEQGRTRIERSGGNILISDPVAGFKAELDPAAKTFSRGFVLSREIGVAGRGVATNTNSIDELKAKLSKLQEERKQEQTRFTDNYPAVKQTEAQIADLQKAIEAQTVTDNYARALTTAGRSGGEPGQVRYSVSPAQPKQVELQTTDGTTLTLRVNQGDNGSVESLPSQMVNGAMAEGTRTTETIPVGKIGNDRVISIVNERWFSNDLRMVVKSTSSDPRFGDTTYQLLNLVQTSPDPSLFQIPADYTQRK